MLSFKKNTKTLLFLQIYFLILTSIKCQTNTGNSFSVITPPEIIEEIEKINQIKSSEIPYRIGKFGDIPFGK